MKKTLLSLILLLSCVCTLACNSETEQGDTTGTQSVSQTGGDDTSDTGTDSDTTALETAYETLSPTEGLPDFMDISYVCFAETMPSFGKRKTAQEYIDGCTETGAICLVTVKSIDTGRALEIPKEECTSVLMTLEINSIIAKGASFALNVGDTAEAVDQTVWARDTRENSDENGIIAGHLYSCIPITEVGAQYVVEIDPELNITTVGLEADYYADALTVPINANIGKAEYTAKVYSQIDLLPSAQQLSEGMLEYVFGKENVPSSDEIKQAVQALKDQNSQASVTESHAQ